MQMLVIGCPFLLERDDVRRANQFSRVHYALAIPSLKSEVGVTPHRCRTALLNAFAFSTKMLVSPHHIYNGFLASWNEASVHRFISKVLPPHIWVDDGWVWTPLSRQKSYHLSWNYDWNRMTRDELCDFLLGDNRRVTWRVTPSLFSHCKGTTFPRHYQIFLVN